MKYKQHIAIYKPNMATILHNTNILEIPSEQAQVIAFSCEYISTEPEGLAKEIYDEFPHANFSSLKKREPGHIKILGSSKRNQRFVLAMFNREKGVLKEDLTKKCLEEIGKGKGLKSIVFPMDDSLGIIQGWARKNPQLKVYIASKTHSLEFLTWFWETASPWINKEKIFSEWKTFQESADSPENSPETFPEDSSENSPETSPPPEDSPKTTPKDEPKTTPKNLPKNPTYQNTSFEDFILAHTPKGWEDFFQRLQKGEYLSEISKKLSKKTEDTIFPPLTKVLYAFERCPPQDIKVVIIGQDPYHTPGAAMGLAFSTPLGAPIQPSLRVIYKELKSDGFKPDPEGGDLTYWADQGVFLINTALTVSKGNPDSHGKEIWGDFIEQLFWYLNKTCDHLVIIMWGSKAKSYSKFFGDQHHKITGGHPSPVNRHGGFLGTKPFSKANNQLEAWGKELIDWDLVVDSEED